MKNHYISQFVIRRFSDAINIFDIHSGKIDENKRPHKVFFHEDIFDEETENPELIKKAIEGMRKLDENDMLMLLGFINRLLRK